jgi:hypothetical protein
MVLNGRAIAFRPMELLIYRDRAAQRIVYAKAGSRWDPDSADRDTMRSIARRIGDELHRRAAYRGVFTVDGILSKDGFVPTEVNTRFGGALPITISADAGEPINLVLLNMLAIEGLIDDLDAIQLERWITNSLDAHRYATGMFQTAGAPIDDRSMTIARDRDGELVEVDQSDGERLANITWGARGNGGLMFVRSSRPMASGPPSAPEILELARLADREWTVGLPSLEPAVAVR